jgi:hypothetical protein
MYFDLMLDPAFAEAYEYFLYMEPDLTAVRAGWLDQLTRECHDELHSFWMKGVVCAHTPHSRTRSCCVDNHNRTHTLTQNEWWPFSGSIYAGPKYVSDETDSPWLFHINGNAIYHVGDPEFRDYIKKVRYVDLPRAVMRGAWCVGG